MKKILTLMLLGLFSASIAAKDMNQRFAVFGVGAENCTDYLQARQTMGKPQQEYYHFITGYLSAFNLIVPGTYNILGKRNLSGALEWLDNYCRANGQENFTNAMARLTEAYYDERENFTRDEDQGWFAPSEPGVEKRRPLSW